MRYAILSDIHANLEALETAVDFAKKREIDSWVVLGDTVGYGANPNECLEWVLDKADIVIVGNHEKATIDPAVRANFNPWAKESIIWTEGVVDDKFKKKIPDIPFAHAEKNVAFSHGSLHEPEQFHYLVRFEDAVATFEVMEQPVCFVGHTHVPGCFCESERSAKTLKPGALKLKRGDRYILNPGSVGQPRDYDPRLAFGIYDDKEKTFQVFRLDYENGKAAEKIRKAGLPRYLADRLM